MTYTEEDLTGWITDRQPWEPGVYMQKAEMGKIGFQRWDGSKWFAWCTNPEDAARERFQVSDRYQNDPWRGLARDPRLPTPRHPPRALFAFAIAESGQDLYGHSIFATRADAESCAGERDEVIRVLIMEIL